MYLVPCCENRFSPAATMVGAGDSLTKFDAKWSSNGSYVTRCSIHSGCSCAKPRTVGKATRIAIAQDAFFAAPICICKSPRQRPIQNLPMNAITADSVAILLLDGLQTFLTI